MMLLDVVRHRSVVALFSVLVVLTLGGCGDAATEPEAAPEPTPGPRVENAEIALALAEVPGFWTVVDNGAGGIVLRPSDATVEGELTISADAEEVGGVNLVAAQRAHKEEINAKPNGEYKGQSELMTQLGTAFSSRGRWDGADGRQMEESLLLALHPIGNRKLRASYVYPAGDDSAARLQDHL
ncbi:MAG: hypothetical protein AAGN46_13480, partial [Acidobacteriota bacterium]